MIKSVNTRELILNILLEITEEGEYSHIVIKNVLDKYQYLDKKERGFITRVSEGTLERMIEIDYIIDQYSKVKTNKMKPVIRNILRSAVYQMKYMDSVPDSAVCNEAVKLAEGKGFRNLKGFVNGVLRSIQRNLGKISYPEEDEILALSIRYSMPEWIIRQWLDSYSLSDVECMLQAFLTDSGMLTVRCNTYKTEPEILKLMLEREGIEVAVSPYLSYAFHLSKYDYIKKIPGFSEGLFQIQDVSSMLAAEVAAPEKDSYCLDICAAPGGKTLHLAEILKGTGTVEARDLTVYKTEQIKENVLRMGADNIKVKEQDALCFDKDSVEKADVLIVDAPCSGLGVLKKKTDLKYKMTREKQKQLVQLQRGILETVWSYVKKGGTLLYCTCTINKEENEQNVQWFLEHFPFQAVSIEHYLCKELHESSVNKGYLQLLPGIHKTDGFFIAKLMRKDGK